MASFPVPGAGGGVFPTAGYGGYNGFNGLGQDPSTLLLTLLQAGNLFGGNGGGNNNNNNFASNLLQGAAGAQGIAQLLGSLFAGVNPNPLIG